MNKNMIGIYFMIFCWTGSMQGEGGVNPASAAYLQAGVVAERLGAAHPNVAPYQVFATAGHGTLFVADFGRELLVELADRRQIVCTRKGKRQDAACGDFVEVRR